MADMWWWLLLGVFGRQAGQKAARPEPAAVESRITVMAADGSAKTVVYTAARHFEAPNWSPDGGALVYCARRDNNFDIYSIAVSGGPEKRLTSAPGYDDGPDYSPDGKWIYFNSDRGGSWDIWRIPASGGGEGDRLAERVTSDEMEDWFPHPSPDGKWLLFLRYPPGTKGHPANLQVKLRIMPLGGGPIWELDSLLGGQGTINVPSWSPKGQLFAYFTYRPLGAGDTASR